MVARPEACHAPENASERASRTTTANAKLGVTNHSEPIAVSSQLNGSLGAARPRPLYCQDDPARPASFSQSLLSGANEPPTAAFAVGQNCQLESNSASDKNQPPAAAKCFSAGAFCRPASEIAAVPPKSSATWSCIMRFLWRTIAQVALSDQSARNEMSRLRLTLLRLSSRTGTVKKPQSAAEISVYTRFGRLVAMLHNARSRPFNGNKTA